MQSCFFISPFFFLSLSLSLRSLKAKYRSLVIRKIIRELEKDKQLPRTSILEAMMMLKTAWDEVTNKTIVNCFRKSGISEDARKGAIDDHDDPFKEMVYDPEDDSAAEEEDDAVEELQFDLDRLRKTRPDLAPEDLNADTLIDFDIEVVTYESQPLSIDEIVSEYLPQPVKTHDLEDISSDKDDFPDNPISPPSQNEVDEAVEVLNKLALFKADSELDPLLLKVSNQINQRRFERMKQTSITDFFLNSESM